RPPCQQLISSRNFWQLLDRTVQIWYLHAILDQEYPSSFAVSRESVIISTYLQHPPYVEVPEIACLHSTVFDEPLRRCTSCALSLFSRSDSSPSIRLTSFSMAVFSAVASSLS